MIDNYKNKLKSTLSEKRYKHSLGVCDEAVKLAEKYGADAVCEMVAEHTGQNGSERIEAVSSGIGDDNASQIANLINAGTQRIIEGGEKRTPDRSLAVDPFTNLPM